MFAWRFMRLKSVVRKSLYGGFPKQFAGKLISAVISLFLNGMPMFVVLVSTNGWGKDSPYEFTRVWSMISDGPFFVGKVANAKN
jgi:hypothetical protein